MLYWRYVPKKNLSPEVAMRPRILSPTIASIFIALLTVITLSSAAHAANTIGGYIFDKTGFPLADIDVELLDEYKRLAPIQGARVKTDSSGRFQFTGLNDGNYTVRVYAFRYDLEDAEQYVEAKSLSAIPGQSGSGYFPVDFYLQPKRGTLRALELGVIFAQDVPKAAEQAYKQAIEDLKAKRPEEGFSGLKKAINLFPNYYEALMRFGQELILRKEYLPAVQTFLKAGQINPKSGYAYYYAGFALQSLGRDYYKASTSALNYALELAPASVQVLTLLGSVERRMGRSAEAEKHLLMAKKLSPQKNPDVQIELANLYANDMKKYKEAADELEGYIKASGMNDVEAAKTKEKVADLRRKAAQPSN